MNYLKIIANPYPFKPYYGIWTDNIIPLMFCIVMALCLLRFIYRHFNKDKYTYDEFKKHMDQIKMFYPEIWKRYVREEINV